MGLRIVILIQFRVKYATLLAVVIMLGVLCRRQDTVVVPARLDLEIVLGLVILRLVLAFLQVVVPLQPQSPLCLAEHLILSPVRPFPPWVVRMQHDRVGERPISPVVLVEVRRWLVLQVLSVKDVVLPSPRDSLRLCLRHWREIFLKGRDAKRVLRSKMDIPSLSRILAKT